MKRWLALCVLLVAGCIPAAVPVSAQTVPTPNTFVQLNANTLANTCINIARAPQGVQLYSITWGGPAAMTGTISVFINEGTAQCNATDLLEHTQSFGIGQSILFGPQYAGAGISILLSASLADVMTFSIRQ